MGELRKLKKQSGTVLSCLFILISFNQCNVFSGLDSPSGQREVQARARACFNRGNLNCALDNYEKLNEMKSSLSNAEQDEVNAEKAILLLHQEGLDLQQLGKLISDTSDGFATALSNLSNVFAPEAGEQTRKNLLDIYHTALDINLDELRGLVRLLSAFSFFSEILAEDTGSDNVFTADDLVANSSKCQKITVSECVTAEKAKDSGKPIPDSFPDQNPCRKPKGKKIEPGSKLDLESSDVDISGSPTLFMLNESLNAIIDTIDNDFLGSSIASGAETFSEDLLGEKDSKGVVIDKHPACYRKLIHQFIFE